VTKLPPHLVDKRDNEAEDYTDPFPEGFYSKKRCYLDGFNKAAELILADVLPVLENPLECFYCGYRDKHRWGRQCDAKGREDHTCDWMISTKQLLTKYQGTSE